MKIRRHADDYGRLFIVLSPSQISRWDLVCAFRSRYPHVRIIAEKPILTQTKRNRPPE